MNLIKKDKLNIVVENSYAHPFEVTEDGTYLIEITASAKSWWQNFKNLRSFFRDDDLILKIDGVEFPKLNGKSGLFDGEVAWNGNNLKGCSKSNVFIIYLNKGNHKLEFFADQSPFLENVVIYKISEEKIDYIPEENNPAQDGDRRQWMTITPVNVAMKILSISAIAKKYLADGDDDDIKLIIDGNVQKNETVKSHKNWFWCGRVSDGQEKVFKQELNLTGGLHYVELWADRMPEIKSIKIAINNNEPKKRIPTVDEPEWTGDFADDSEQMILARAIFGEARSLPEEGKIAVGWSIRNRTTDSRWGDTYHKVILQPHQYSAFNENDKNIVYVKNPFFDKKQIQAWRECYEIAGKIIDGKANDLTDGANHYFSDYIDSPRWTKQKNAEFKIKIDNTLFYNLKKENRGGFIKNAVLVLVCVGALLLGFFFCAVKIKSWCNSKNEASNTWEAERYKHFFINPKTEEIEVVHFDKNGNFLRSKQITNDRYSKNQLIVFSDTEMLGYFQELHRRGEEYGGNTEEYYKNYTALMVKNNEYDAPREIYRGDVHTSSWEWADKKHVIIHYGCGTSCYYFYKINIATKEIVEEGHEYGKEKEAEQVS